MSKRYKAKRRERYTRKKQFSCTHQFKDVYYGSKCVLCGLFYPAGGAPWDEPWNGDDDFEVEDGDSWCGNCSNTGYVNCHCGGDLCVCENQGEMPCPVCGGF